MGFFVLSPPYTGISEPPGTPSITSRNLDAGTLGIKNEVYVGGSFQVIAGFSRIFTLPFGTTSVQVGADFVASGELLARSLHWGYSRASLLVNVKAIGLNVFNMPNGDNHELRRPITEEVAGFYYQTPNIEPFRGWFWESNLPAFTPAATTRRYVLSAAIESWAGCVGYGSWAISNIADGSTFEGFLVTTVP